MLRGKDMQVLTEGPQLRQVPCVADGGAEDARRHLRGHARKLIILRMGSRSTSNQCSLRGTHYQVWGKKLRGQAILCAGRSKGRHAAACAPPPHAGEPVHMGPASQSISMDEGQPAPLCDYITRLFLTWMTTMMKPARMTCRQAPIRSGSPGGVRVPSKQLRCLPAHPKPLHRALQARFASCPHATGTWLAQ